MRLGRPPLRVVLPVVTLLLLLGVGFVPAPYVIEEPGPVFDTLGSTRIDGKQVPIITIKNEQTYPTTGALDMLTVSLLGGPDGTADWVDLAAAWLDPAKSVIPVEEVYPTGVSQQQVSQQDTADMSESQQAAQAAALTQLGRSVRGTVKVVEVRAGSAAQGVLEAGDVVTSVNGASVLDSCSLQDAVAANGTRAATVVVERSGKRVTLHLAPRAIAGSSDPVLGVQVTSSYQLPGTITLRLDDVGGPSAGQMFALGIIDKLTPGSLAGGSHVAGTGTICADGTVGAIGGIVQKMYGARGAGATVFLAPKSNCDEVTGHIPSGLQVFAVGKLADSVRVLERIARGGSTAGLPRCPG